MLKIWSGVLAVVALLVGGCASTPEAPRDRDAEAKQFLTHPNASTIYVYRIDVEPTDDNVILYTDSRLIGETLPRTYFRIDTVPGRHVLHGVADDLGKLELETRPGALYFVELTVAAGQSNFRPVPEEVGRKRILQCCTLLENWAPGQRPFLK
ncbi:MAG: hypothetical protein JWN13_6882 [Betaproteobacteria bacterium]|jgi:hypothetical protein|nr:hypothetical protein [Betaproteobacteria bacterium]